MTTPETCDVCGKPKCENSDENGVCVWGGDVPAHLYDRCHGHPCKTCGGTGRAERKNDEGEVIGFHAPCPDCKPKDALREEVRETAKKIASDICGRRGGDAWFESIDNEIQDEIIEKWSGIILALVRSREGELAKRMMQAAEKKWNDGCRDAEEIVMAVQSQWMLEGAASRPAPEGKGDGV